MTAGAQENHKRVRAAVGSAVFLVLAPGVVAGLGPFWLTDWQVEEPLPYWVVVRVVGTVLLLAGAAVLVHAFASSSRA